MRPTPLLLTVQEIIHETSDTVTLVLDTPPAMTTYHGGQFLTLSLPLGGQEYQRAYSLATTPVVDPLPAITIKRVQGGIVSNYVNDYVQAGDTLTFLPPQGAFGLHTLPALPQRLVMVAGGSGITPLYAILKEALTTLPTLQVTLLYASRTAEDIIYAHELAGWVQRMKGRLRLCHILSRPAHPWEGPCGRLTPKTLKELLGNDLHPDTHYFLCGPAALMEMAQHCFLVAGVPAHHLHRESFTAPQPPQRSPEAPTTSQVTFCYEGDRYTCTVPATETLLDAAAQEGIDIPYACGTGMCNTCRVRCVEGAVTMTEEEGLTPDEVAQGYVLACVAYPTTPTLTLEVEEA